jgi:glutamate--cysteine ligase
MPSRWTLDTLVDAYIAKSQENVSSIGIEWERSGIYRDTGKPVAYVGTNGYLAILEKLVEELGWEVLQYEEGCGILELRRGITRINIEGDGRPELSGSPQHNLHDLARELRIHINEIREIGNIFGIGWLPTGLQPLHDDKEIPFAPRERYRIFQKIGDQRIMEMYTKRTNGLTVNVGYKDEESAVRMAQTAFRVLPMVGAMFSSSPLERGKPGKYVDMRRWCVQSYAPERTSIPQNILDPDFCLHSWVGDYVNHPVILTKRDNITKAVDQRITFSEWMHKGLDVGYPTMEDFDIHVKTTWSDLRLRPAYLEYRVADSVPFRYALALPALMKGLLLDPKNWDAVEEMTQECTYEDIVTADKKSWSTGLKTKMKGRTLLSYSQDLLKLANDSLHSFKVMNGEGQDESIFLAPLKEQIYIKEVCPADEILRLWESEWQRNYVNLLQWCEDK